MNILTVLEQIILTAILVLKEEAYGVSISRKTRELSGKSIMYGSLYNVLDQLHKKGYVARQVKTPAPGEGEGTGSEGRCRVAACHQPDFSVLQGPQGFDS